MSRALVWLACSTLLVVACDGGDDSSDPWTTIPGGWDAGGDDDAETGDDGDGDDDDDTGDDGADAGDDGAADAADDDAGDDGSADDGTDDGSADDGTDDGSADDGTDDGSGAACTDAMEPNDTVTEAAGVDPEVDYDATICPGDIDYFSFTAPAAGTWAMLAASFDAAAGDIDMKLYQADGTTLVDSSTAGDPVEHIEAWNIAAGQYIIAIEHAGGDEVSYVLNYQLHE